MKYIKIVNERETNKAENTLSHARIPYMVKTFARQVFHVYDEHFESAKSLLYEAGIDYDEVNRPEAHYE